MCEWEQLEAMTLTKRLVWFDTDHIVSTEVAPQWVQAPCFVFAGQSLSPVRSYPVLCHAHSPTSLFVLA